MTLDKVEIKQKKYAEKLDELRVPPARESKYVGLKESISKKCKKKLWRMGKNCLLV